MYKKFKIVTFLFLCLMTLLPINVEAAETDNIKDYLNYLSETEVQELQSSINKISNEYNLDTVIVITDNTDGKSSMQYADDFYDDNNYGIDENKSGILMLVNMSARDVWISTTGSAINIFTDTTIESMVNDITEYLSAKDYNGASSNFLENVYHYCNKDLSVNNTSLDTDTNSVPTSYFNRVISKVTSVSTYIFPFIISMIVTFIVTQNSKWKVTINNSTYEGNSSFKLTKNQDIFVNENTTKTIIPKKSNETSSSSSSTTHSSTSKNTHGGGGGSF
ncbi:MAG: TPM domain-containing protein [Peptostreptococcaceae bacterium]